MKQLAILTLLVCSVVFLDCRQGIGENKTEKESIKINTNRSADTTNTNNENSKGYKVMKSEEEWKKQLTDEQFKVTRKKGTERAFANKYWDNHESGIYKCVCCGQELFTSESKFESGTGWPSFYQPIVKENVKEETDKSIWETRTEALCSNCGAHLGHVFDDGPAPTGLRYCMNSASLDFIPSEKK